MLRETPLHRGHLRLMDLATRAGAVIFPPVPSFYDHPHSLDDICMRRSGAPCNGGGRQRRLSHLQGL